REREVAGLADPFDVSGTEVVGSVRALDDETGLGRELLGGHRDIVYFPAMTAAGGVRLDRDGLVTVLTIDRPEARNAIARTTMQELDHAIDDVEASDARVLVVTGAGARVFVAGGDLKELATIRTHEDATAMAETMRGV